mmetsp:Transcript_10384/g.36164  ORF Transcript_10384/g.36164 Transcript_10384/m.36164 type:complete len:113 (+) Transcript_10384:345-683(+)
MLRCAGRYSTCLQPEWLGEGRASGQDGEAVDSRRICHMSLPASNWAVTSDNRLDIITKHGEHGKATILDFLRLQIGEGVRIICKTKGIKSLTRMQRIKAFTQWASVNTISFR